MAMTVGDITGNADLFRQAYPNWPHPEPEEVPVDSAFRNVDPTCVCCLPAAQEQALRDLCARYNVGYDPDHYKPAFDLPKGWVAGWVGGPDVRKLYVGCDPEGRISSLWNTTDTGASTATRKSSCTATSSVTLTLATPAWPGGRNDRPLRRLAVLRSH